MRLGWLIAWAKKHMQHTDPSDANYGYFAWHCHTSGAIIDPHPASDGETYFATALYFAARRWGARSGPGKIDYRAEADLILHQVPRPQPPRNGCVTALMLRC